MKQIYPVLIALVFFVGCGNRGGLPGETGTVDGTVMYKGNAVSSGTTVMMVHDKTGIVAAGVTDSRGKFTMKMRGKPQVLVGDYAVSIRPAGEVDPNVSKLTMDTVPETWKAIPQKYWMDGKSGERFTVGTGANVYSLVLKD